MEKSIINIIKSLPLDGKYVFKKSDLENWQAQVKYPKLVVLKGTGRFSGYFFEDKYPVEVVDYHPNIEFCGYKESYIQWGIDLLSMVLNQVNVLEIELPHLKSGFKKLYVYRDESKPINYFGLKYNQSITMDSFMYCPGNVNRYPFTDIEEAFIPTFNYAWKDQHQRYTQNSPADYIVITVTTEGLLYLAELFLNFGREQNENNEINFERLRSVFSLNSLEARFWLPGSLFFYQDNLDTL